MSAEPSLNNTAITAATAATGAAGAAAATPEEGGSGFTSVGISSVLTLLSSRFKNAQSVITACGKYLAARNKPTTTKQQKRAIRP